jgi:hypothetical protein
MTARKILAKDSHKFCGKRTSFYCLICFADNPIDCYCDKIIGYHSSTGIPIVNLTDAECQYLSKFCTNEEENAI